MRRGRPPLSETTIVDRSFNDDYIEQSFNVKVGQDMGSDAGQGSRMGSGEQGTPPEDSAVTPLSGAHKTKHHEVQRRERRLKARRKAAEMLEAAMAVDGDPKVAAVAALMVRKLKFDYCDILQFASDRWVVVVRATGTNGNAPLPRAHQSGDPDVPVTTTGVRVDLMQLADGMGSLDVLRAEGTVDRIHVFISSRERLTPHGILTVQSRTSLRLTSDERSFLDALGQLIGAAIDSHALPTGDELSTLKPWPTSPRNERPPTMGSPDADR